MFAGKMKKASALMIALLLVIAVAAPAHAESRGYVATKLDPKEAESILIQSQPQMIPVKDEERADAATSATAAGGILETEAARSILSLGMGGDASAVAPEAARYLVTFYGAQGDLILDGEVEEGGLAKLPETAPEMEGFQFLFWFDEAAEYLAPFDFAAGITRETNLLPYFAPATDEEAGELTEEELTALIEDIVSAQQKVDEDFLAAYKPAEDDQVTVDGDGQEDINDGDADTIIEETDETVTDETETDEEPTPNPTTLDDEVYEQAASILDIVGTQEIDPDNAVANVPPTGEDKDGEDEKDDTLTADDQEDEDDELAATKLDGEDEESDKDETAEDTEEDEKSEETAEDGTVQVGAEVESTDGEDDQDEEDEAEIAVDVEGYVLRDGQVINDREEQILLGDTVVLVGTLVVPEDAQVQMQWQMDTGEGWQPIEGATDASYTYVLNEQTNASYYRLHISTNA